MSIVGSTSLFSLKLFSEFLGESMLNRFWYQAGVSPDTIDVLALIPAFTAMVSNEWEAVVSDDWTAVTVECDEVTSSQNFYTGNSNIGPGLITGDTLGPNVAYSFRLNRATKATRSGWKRIAGVAESSQIDGVAATAQMILNDAFAAVLDNPLTVGIDAIYPVIVRKTYTGDPPVLNDPTDWIYNIISGVSAKENLTTQNTRKYGR